MGNGKRILLADQADEVSIHRPDSSVKVPDRLSFVSQKPSLCKLCVRMPAVGKGQYTSTAKVSRVRELCFASRHAGGSTRRDEQGRRAQRPQTKGSHTVPGKSRGPDTGSQTLYPRLTVRRPVDGTAPLSRGRRFPPVRADCSTTAYNWGCYIHLSSYGDPAWRNHERRNSAQGSL